MGGILSTLAQGISHLIAPRVCRVCGCTLNASEELLCLNCYADVPRANLHNEDFNDIHRRLGHRIKVERAAGWFYYRRKSPYAQLLIDSKYNNLPKIDYTLGKICAEELQEEGFFDGIDLIAPMPMHWWKRTLRGYNQAEEIAEAISDTTNIPYDNAINAVKPHGVQSRNTRDQRYSRIQGTMKLNDRCDISGKHILIVDDIITTGASMAEAIKAIEAGNPAAVSVLTLGVTALV